MTKQCKLSLLICATHPVQYRAPLFRKLAEEIDLEVIYYSRHGLASRAIEGMGVLPKWDVPLLKGYQNSFTRNFSPNKSVSTFAGTINPGAAWRVAKSDKKDVWVFGWNNFTTLMVVMIATIFRKRIWLQAESPVKREFTRPRHIRALKSLLLGKILFKLVHRFLYIGQQNKAFYEYYGVPDHKLVFAPYCVDNDYWQNEAAKVSSCRDKFREENGVCGEDRIVLFVGKLIPKKRPLDLLQAFADLASPGSYLWIVGSGPLQPNLINYIDDNQLTSVKLLGYKNQTELPEIYSAVDAFALPSLDGETWGLVVNEAMNFSLPLVVSDRVGCCDDLVRPQNGHVFQDASADGLKNALKKILDPEYDLKEMGSCSRELVGQYNYSVIVHNVLQALNQAEETRSTTVHGELPVETRPDFLNDKPGNRHAK